jgi:hypothetical protein
VDIGTDLFAMSCVCSYAHSLDSQKDISTPCAFELADLFCHEARIRILRNFKDTWCNQDKQITTIAKKILTGEYAWLENEIIQ